MGEGKEGSAIHSLNRFLQSTEQMTYHREWTDFGEEGTL